MIRGARLLFIIVGALQILLSLMFIICSKVVLEKYNSRLQWYSLLYMYFSLLGLMCIISGIAKKRRHLVKLSICLHVIAIVIGTIGAAVSSVFWQMYKESGACGETEQGDCICFHEKYDIDCVDGDLSRRILAALTAANIIVILTSFLGTILGFTVTCCDPSNNFREEQSRMEHSEQTAESSVFVTQTAVETIRLSAV
ncbi:uncharacterized protein LOC124451121 isoform X2 [Xenia sp. Carnegie-2017]|uniref:uncharacterized protein LOC124451121 isoform X2 n=1 Tax=Xenia sp. Carnegie-2017 TaxID=2897299 RepID=UPI001F04160D|nr:uncharacterized protein LOC124451121 isoform X2 [Xenia sp. Carnegie-2017]